MSVNEEITDEMFLCDVCGKAFADKPTWIYHLQNHTTLLTSKFYNLSNAESSPAGTFKCPISDEDLSDTASLESPFQAHRLKSSKLEGFKKVVTQRYSLETISSEESAFVCNICGKCFSNKNLLDNHNDSHSKEKVWACDLCLETFEHKSLFTEHTDTVHKVVFSGDGVESSDFSDRHSSLVRQNTPRTQKKIFQCTLCGKTFYHENNFATHQRIHTVGRSHKCKICHKAFALDKYLIKHLAVHDEDKKIKCDLCDRKYASRTGLELHKKTHLGEKPFVCHICNKSFTQKVNLNAHLKTHNGLKHYECNICKKRFKQKLGLQLHLQRHAGLRPFTCDICNKEYIQKAHLKNHVNSVHTGGSFKCDKCNETFMAEFCLTMHNCHSDEKTVDSDANSTASNQSEQKTYECRHCKLCFSKKSVYKKHITLHNGKYECSICLKKFKWKSQLIVHSRQHSGEKPYECDQCGKKFSQTEYLKIHYRLHSGEKPFECETCDKKFCQKANLIKHQRCHTGERPYSCDQCGKTFTQKGNLDTHYRRHTGQKRYKCDICQKAFTQKGNLDIHYRRHAGDKRYNCDICQKAFYQKGNLGKHYKQHSISFIKKKVTFDCHFCHKVFRQKVNKDRHLLLHTREKPYSCNKCGQAFSLKGNWKKHQNHCHKVDSKVQNNKILFKCDMCDKFFNSEVSFKEHNKLYQLYHTRKYECMVCNKRFSQLAQLQRHRPCISVELSAIIEVDKQIKSTLKKKELSETSPYECIACNETFSQMGLLEEHSQCHSDELESSIIIKAAEQIKSTLKEKNPTEIFQNETLQMNLLEHSQSHSDELESSKKIEPAEQVETTLKDSNPTETSPDECTTSNKIFKCDKCNIMFSSKLRYNKHNRHYRLHHAKPHACIICYKRFSEMIQLQRHTQSHSKQLESSVITEAAEQIKSPSKENNPTETSPDECATSKKTFKCDKCNKTFSSKLIYKRNHKRYQRHHAKPHACIICNNTLSEMVHLQRQLPSDSGELESPAITEAAEQIKSTFRENNPTETSPRKTSQMNFLEHSQFHSIELESSVIIEVAKQIESSSQENKPTEISLYECIVCNKTFSQMSLLEEHSQSHSGELESSIIIEAAEQIKSTSKDNNSSETSQNKNPQMSLLKEHSQSYSRELESSVIIQAAEEIESTLKQNKPTEISVYECIVCNKTFSQMSLLEEHSHCHSDELESSIIIKAAEQMSTSKENNPTETPQSKTSEISLLEDQSQYHSRELESSIIIQAGEQIESTLKENKPAETYGYECIACNKTFSQLNLLEEHSQCHSDELESSIIILAAKQIYMNRMIF